MKHPETTEFFDYAYADALPIFLTMLPLKPFHKVSAESGATVTGLLVDDRSSPAKREGRDSFGGLCCEWTVP